MLMNVYEIFFYFKHTNIVFKRIVEQFKKLKQSPFMN